MSTGVLRKKDREIGRMGERGSRREAAGRKHEQEGRELTRGRGIGEQAPRGQGGSNITRQRCGEKGSKTALLPQ